MNANDYMFRDRDGETLIKPPGSVNGNGFILDKLHNCEVYILDHTSQVQVDDCVDCKIFIGPTDGSVFLRDCRDCTLCVAARQLRTRDCKDLDIALYCATQPSIETSTGIVFSCWRGAYPGLTEHFRQARLDPTRNTWMQVYDFNSKEDLGAPHFRLDESVRPWWTAPSLPDGQGQGQVEGSQAPPDCPVPAADGSLFGGGRLASPPKSPSAGGLALPESLPPSPGRAAAYDEEVVLEDEDVTLLPPGVEDGGRSFVAPAQPSPRGEKAGGGARLPAVTPLVMAEADGAFTFDSPRTTATALAPAPPASAPAPASEPLGGGVLGSLSPDPDAPPFGAAASRTATQSEAVGAPGFGAPGGALPLEPDTAAPAAGTAELLAGAGSSIGWWPAAAVWAPMGAQRDAAPVDLEAASDSGGGRVGDDGNPFAFAAEPPPQQQQQPPADAPFDLQPLGPELGAVAGASGSDGLAAAVAAASSAPPVLAGGPLANNPFSAAASPGAQDPQDPAPPPPDQAADPEPQQHPQAQAAGGRPLGDDAFLGTWAGTATGTGAATWAPPSVPAGAAASSLLGDDFWSAAPEATPAPHAALALPSQPESATAAAQETAPAAAPAAAAAVSASEPDWATGTALNGAASGAAGSGADGGGGGGALQEFQETGAPRGPAPSSSWQAIAVAAAAWPLAHPVPAAYDGGSGGVQSVTTPSGLALPSPPPPLPPLAASSFDQQIVAPSGAPQAAAAEPETAAAPADAAADATTAAALREAGDAAADADVAVADAFPAPEAPAEAAPGVDADARVTWRAANGKRLSQLLSEEFRAKSAVQEEARRKLEAMQQTRAALLNQRFATNRANDKSAAEAAAAGSGATGWARVAELVNLSGSAAAGSGAGGAKPGGAAVVGRDTARLRQLMIMLKSRQGKPQVGK